MSLFLKGHTKSRWRIPRKRRRYGPFCSSMMQGRSSMGFATAQRLKRRRPAPIWLPLTSKFLPINLYPFTSAFGDRCGTNSPKSLAAAMEVIPKLSALSEKVLKRPLRQKKNCLPSSRAMPAVKSRLRRPFLNGLKRLRRPPLNSQTSLPMKLSCGKRGGRVSS